MAELPLTGKRGQGRVTQVSDERHAALSQLQWRVKKFPSGYEQVIRSGRDGWRSPLNRFIMEQKIGRPLRSEEHAHHKDGDTFNNRDENLELLTKGAHIAEHNRRSESWRRAERAATAKRRASPHCGTYPAKNGLTWKMYYGGKYRGSFPSQEAASSAYREIVEQALAKK